jgi:hypothetical protein
MFFLEMWWIWGSPMAFYFAIKWQNFALKTNLREKQYYVLILLFNIADTCDKWVNKFYSLISGGCCACFISTWQKIPFECPLFKFMKVVSKFMFQLIEVLFPKGCFSNHDLTDINGRFTLLSIYHSATYTSPKRLFNSSLWEFWSLSLGEKDAEQKF